MGKSGTRRQPCFDCFGQGIRPYVADSTGNHHKKILSSEYVAEEAFPWEDPVYCTADSKKKAFVRKRICRTCGGLGYIECSHPWVVRLLRGGSFFEVCVGSYVEFKQERVYEESFPYYRDHFQQAATMIYEIPQLDVRINRMHRRAQRAEGKIAHLEHLYKKEHARAERLLQELRALHGIDHELRGGRVPKTVRIKKQKESS